MTMEIGELAPILDAVYFGEVHERETLANLGLLIRDGDFVVDVGSSLGQYAWFLNCGFERLKVVCVEADGIRYRELDRRCREWTATGRNDLVAVNAAACAQEGFVTFFTTSTNVSGSLLPTGKTTDGERRDASAVAPAAVQVRALTLDSLCLDAMPSLVKVDAEGGEVEVVRGATRLLESGVPRFLIEEDRRCDRAALAALFSARGYRRLRFFDHTLFYHPECGRRLPSGAILARRIWYKLTRRWLEPRVSAPPPALATGAADRG